MDEAITAVVLEEVETYTLRRKKNAAWYIATWPIINIFLAAER